MNVDGVVRVVNGLERTTTVRDIILALAKSMNQPGSYYLVEMQKSVNLSCDDQIRVMLPDERPVDIFERNLTDLTLRAEFFLVRCDIKKPESNKMIDEIMKTSDADEGTVLLEMLEFRLHMMDKEIAAKRDMLKRLETENRKLNSCLYKISRWNLSDIRMLECDSKSYGVDQSSLDPCSSETASASSSSSVTICEESMKSNVVYEYFHYF